jgi:uncharacterized membrane protein
MKRVLQFTGVRILLGFFLSNMVFSIVAPDLATTVLSVILRIIVMGVFYYLLTLYVNNKRKGL